MGKEYRALVFRVIVGQGKGFIDQIGRDRGERDQAIIGILESAPDVVRWASRAIRVARAVGERRPVRQRERSR